MITSLDEQIACVSREIALRERVLYPKWGATGRMTKQEADRELVAMKAALGTLMAARSIMPLRG
jgi:hypothetical protein